MHAATPSPQHSSSDPNVPTMAELIDAMPVDDPEVDTANGIAENQQFMQSLLTGLAMRPVPTNRLGRFWILGSLQAKVGAAYLAWWLRRWYRTSEKNQQSLNEAHLKAAFRMLSSMSYLRGAAMKFGQVLANSPNTMPTEFAEILGSLHFEAPPMHFSLLREFVRKELGQEPEELFEEFDTQPIAAASLGQVHRARLKSSGQVVAVKIQYPNIARTIDSDLKNLKAICVPMRMLEDWDSLMDGYEDIHRMLTLECDYEYEAENLRIARQAFTGNDDIVVPRVYPELSTSRVLTMDFVPGLHLREYLQTNPSQHDRNRFGALIAHSTFQLSYGSKMLHADPHPGNYTFMPDGRLGLLDFGCCVRYNDEELDYVIDFEKAYRSESEDEIRQAVARASRLSPKQTADDKRLTLLKSWGDWVWEPQRTDGPFDFGDASYFKRGTDIYKEIMRKRYIRSRPLNTWIARAIFGVRAILTEMEANIDYRAIWKEHSDRHVRWD